MKIVLVVAAIVIAGCHAESDPRCAWGESYWCSSLKSAKSCGAIDHCKTTVWKNQILKADGNDTCMFCKSIISDVRQFLSQKKTEEDIGRYVAEACGLIPNPTVSADCKAAVETMLDVLFQLVIEELDPQMICGLMGVCSGPQDTVKHSPVPPVIGAGAEPICTDCKKFFGDIRDMITSNSTRSQLEQLFDSTVCAILGPLKNECKDLVHQFVPEVLQLLSKYYDPNLICKALGVCGNQKSLNLLFTTMQRFPFYQVARQNSAETCIICKTVLTELQSLDRDKDVQDKVLNFLKTDVCSLLGSFRAECEVTVGLYGPDLFQLIATELDPDTRCKSLGFCDGAGQLDQSPKMSPFRPAKPLNVRVMTNVKVKESPECILCEFVIRELRSLIGDNATEAEIKAALDKVCSYLPATLADECKSFVTLYGDLIIQLLLSEMDPQQICTQLGLCGNSKSRPVLPPATAAVGNAELCVVCETIVQYLEALLEQNATVAEIEAVLDKICDYLPSTLKPSCDEVVQKYGPLIVHYISTAESPQEICTLAKVCDGKKLTSPVVEKKEVAKKASMLGQNECTWGPSYWCASRENADKCNAVDHCKNNVWNKQ